jgi:hypothetical protein
MGRSTKAKHAAERGGPEQRDRFIEAARKAGASEDEREFDRALKRVAKPKEEPKPKRG